MKKDKIFALGMVAVVVSFFGFVLENVWMAITKGYMNNRSVIFPFLFGYGATVVAIFLIFGMPRKMRLFHKKIHLKHESLQILLYFAIMMLCVSVGEFVLGNTVEKVCGFHWWNYSNIPLHITQYTSIPTSAGFALLITIFMDKCFGSLYNIFYHTKNKVVRAIGYVLIAIMTLDFIHSSILMYRRRRTILRWKLRLR